MSTPTFRGDSIRADSVRPSDSEVTEKTPISWGRVFRYLLPYWKAELKKEMADGGTGWNTQRAKRLFFQRSAVVLARGNANMIKQATSAAARIGRMGA